jgi:hypothetical protein
MKERSAASGYFEASYRSNRHRIDESNLKISRASVIISVLMLFVFSNLIFFSNATTTVSASPPYSTGGYGWSGTSSSCPGDASSNPTTGELWAYVNVGWPCTTSAWGDVDLHFTAAYGATSGVLKVSTSQEDYYVYNGGGGLANLYIIANLYDDSNNGNLVKSVTMQNWGSMSQGVTGGSQNLQQTITVTLTSGHNYHWGIFWKGYVSPNGLSIGGWTTGTNQNRDNLNGNDAAHVLVNSISWTY